MKNIFKSSLIFVLLSTLLLSQLPGASIQGTHKYLGQKAPGMAPQKFAPGTVSTDAFEFAGTFSADGKTFVYTKRPTGTSSNRIVFMELKGKKWTAPASPSFAKDVFEFEPHFAPGTQTLFYSSDRPRPEGITSKGSIWVVKRTVKGWGTPQFLDAP